MKNRILHYSEKALINHLEGSKEGVISISGNTLDYHLIKKDLSSLKVDFIVPDELLNLPSFYNQQVVQGRVTDENLRNAILSIFGDLFGAGGKMMETFSTENILFISDASNYPFNEGHFIIQNGQPVNLPQDCQQPQGKHYFATIDDEAKLSFEILDLNNPASYQHVKKGFFVSQIIKDQQQIKLTDEVTDCDKLLIADFRGHLGQIFNETAYSKMNSPERAHIHNKLVELLRDSINNKELLGKIVNGEQIDWGELNGVPITTGLPLNIFNHTYWIQTDKNEIFLLKVYPKANGAAGVSFDDTKKLLDTIASKHGIVIQNAYIGTNGKDVRIIVPDKNGKLKPITQTLDERPLEFNNNRSLANFIIVRKDE